MKKLNIYKTKIKLPEQIIIEKNKNFIKFSGPLGSTQINLYKIDKQGVATIKINEEKTNIIIQSSSFSFFNSLCKMIKNKISGISRGFLVYLRIIGIGYRANISNNDLFLKLGYSHDVKYNIPKSIRMFLIEPTLICIFGIDKNQVTQIAAKIRQIKPPSPYKGKGIRLIDEKIYIKQGKQK